MIHDGMSPMSKEPCRFFLWSDATPVVQDNAVPAWHSERRLIMVSGMVQDKDYQLASSNAQGHVP
ncbi:hypothetical protein T11_15472 [Trichinella zimbabwensis]|uniref:Uncharacterized protein n=2 Tax=Trichinella TaxID=6333 RepID=A0A0V1MVZ9_9BILA|nr:hypothetical protein T11_15472 [Trichinella zimbabwensis]KRZ75701.1 hypothetical protein T10_2719 [Trichinella papuae]